MSVYAVEQKQLLLPQNLWGQQTEVFCEAYSIQPAAEEVGVLIKSVCMQSQKQ